MATHTHDGVDYCWCDAGVPYADLADEETMTLRGVCDEAILDLEAEATYQGRDPDA